jgi:hypothetical protein
MYWQQAQYMGSPYGQFQQPFYPPGYAGASPGKGGAPGFDPSQQQGGLPGQPGASTSEGGKAVAPADSADAGSSDDEKKPSAAEGEGAAEKEEKDPKESASGSLPL